MLQEEVFLPTYSLSSLVLYEKKGLEAVLLLQQSLQLLAFKPLIFVFRLCCCGFCFRLIRVYP